MCETTTSNPLNRNRHQIFARQYENDKTKHSTFRQRIRSKAQRTTVVPARGKAAPRDLTSRRKGSFLDAEWPGHWVCLIDRNKPLNRKCSLGRSCEGVGVRPGRGRVVKTVLSRDWDVVFFVWNSWSVLFG